MNKTYKVVFNKVRGALMVANEATSCVQKKGTKQIMATFLISAALSSFVAPSFAAESLYVTSGLVEKTGEVSYEFNSVYAESTGSVVLGGNTTDSISINHERAGDLAYGIRALEGGQVEVNGKNLTINVTGTEKKGYAGGLWAQNNSATETAPDGASSITINALNTSIKATADYSLENGTSTWAQSIGIAAMSNGQIRINGNLEIVAEDVILTRGYANTVINEKKDKTVKLTGNIDFNYDKATSGTTVDSSVLVNLSNSESFWTGRVLASNDSVGEIPLPSEDPNFNIGSNATGVVLGLSNGGTWNATGKSLVNTLNMENGGVMNVQSSEAVIIYVGNMTVSGLGNKLSMGESALQITNSLKFTKDSELITDLNSVYTPTFETVENVENVLTNASAKLDTAKVTVDSSATLTIIDEFTYSTDGLTALTGAYADLTLNLLNATLLAGQEAVLTDGYIQSAEEVSTQTDAVDENGATTVAVKNSGGQTLTVKAPEEATETISSVTLNVKGDETSTNFTLVGSSKGGALVKNAEGEAIAVTVGKGVTLNLGTAGSEVETAGSLADVRLDESSAMNVQNIAVDVNKLTTASNAVVFIGNEVHRGSLSVNDLALAADSTIFLDPAWSGDAALDTVANASHLAVSEITELNGNLIAGQNSLVAVGATADEAVAGFKALTAANSALSWGDNNVTAALYIANPIAFAANSTGKIVIDGVLKAKPKPDDLTGYTSNVNVAANGMLMVDQAAIGSETAINGTLSLAGGSYVGLVNANEGTVKLATSVTQGGAIDVVTDNPFITAALSQDGNSVAASLDAANGLGALASTGLQAMTRRADSVLASTIADRTSIDQELNAGINLWVDVRGENYQSDNFDNGGEFDADMGYGTFGGDVAFGAFTAGAAFQYGTGSLRSSVSSIKNSIDNYAFALYGTYKVTDAFKLAAELAYVWGENDITSSQAALNQSVDTEMYSFGLRAMCELKAGNFSFVPSIGLRVSQLSTDAFQVGSVKVEDQDQTLVQVPIALRINASEFDASGWAVTPSFKIAYVPTFGDKDIEVLNHTQDVIDTAPVQADFGLRIGKDNMMFNVNMLLGAGEYGTSAIGGKVGFKYAF